MLRGCQKKIIYVKNTKSPFFEEAYFILKNNASVIGASDSDMLVEAARIVDENLLGIYCSNADSQSKEKRARKKFLSDSPYASTMIFLAGVAASGLVCAAAMLLSYTF